MGLEEASLQRSVAVRRGNLCFPGGLRQQVVARLPSSPEASLRGLRASTPLIVGCRDGTGWPVRGLVRDIMRG